MKKFSLMLLLAVLCTALIFPLYACGENPAASSSPSASSSVYNPFNDPEYYDTVSNRASVDTANAVTDDFDGSLNADLWKIVDGAWHFQPDASSKGNDYHNGDLKENVFLIDNYDDADGVLALRATGDFYDYSDAALTARFNAMQTGENINSTRSAGCLATTETYGPGRYEVTMKATPVEGSVSALWTFYWGGNEQHEIDIEIVGGGDAAGGQPNGFDRIWFTSWTKPTTTTSSQPYLSDLGYDWYLNDGEWHTFTFDWYTNYNSTGEKRIDWFIDGKLVYSLNGSEAQSVIADKAGNIWLGAWLSGWSGAKNFNTAYMYVDEFTYTPFAQQTGWTKTTYEPDYRLFTPVKTATGANEYVVPIIESPVDQRLSNVGFEELYDGKVVVMNNKNIAVGSVIGWTQNDILGKTGGTVSSSADAKSGTKAIVITENAYASQEYTKVYDNYSFDFEIWAKKASSSAEGCVEIVFYNNSGALIRTETITLDITSTDYTKISQEITTPDGTRKMVIRLKCTVGSITCDDASLIYTGVAAQ